MRFFTKTTLLLSITSILTACGGGGNSSTQNSPVPPKPDTATTISATLLGHGNEFTWEKGENIAIQLLDNNNQVVEVQSCLSDDTVRLTVQADCKALTIHRLGNSTLTVTGANGLKTKLTVSGVPEKSPFEINSMGYNSNKYIVKENGQLLVWGNRKQLAINPVGQFIENVTYPTTIVKSDGTALSNIYQATTGLDENYALNKFGQVYGWGWSFLSELTLSNNQKILYPELIAADLTRTKPLTGIVKISLSHENGSGGNPSIALAINDEGKLVRWGDSSDRNYLPKVLEDQSNKLSNLRQVTVGEQYGYVVNDKGEVFEIGVNRFNNETYNKVRQIKDIDGVNLSDVVKIMTTSSASFTSLMDAPTMALTKDGKVYVWGTSNAAQLADERFADINYRLQLQRSGVLQGSRLVYALPIKVNGVALTGIKDIASNVGTMYALTNSGNVYAWGSNESSRLGVGISYSDKNDSSVPLLVRNENNTANLANIIAITTANKVAYALKNDGSLVGWGNNEYSTLLTRPMNEATAFKFPISIWYAANQPLTLDLSKYTRLN